MPAPSACQEEQLRVFMKGNGAVQILHTAGAHSGDQGTATVVTWEQG